MQIFDTLPEKLQNPTSVAVGYFDGVHKAHRAVIDKAVSYRQKGLSPLVFSFNMLRETPKKKKGALLLQTFSLKTQSIKAAGADIFLCPSFSSFMSMTMEEFAVDLLYKRLNAKAVTCGFDYHFGKGASGNADDLKRILSPYGVEVNAIDAIMKDENPVSSTLIRSLLEKGEIQEANELLGYSFAIDFEVSHGRNFGKQMGFPTANQIFPQNMIIPKFGVYKTRVEIDGKSYMGVTNVGRKPSVGATDYVGAETYVDGFSGDLYGKKIKTSFLKFLRPEMKFSSLDELKSAINDSIIKAREN